MKILHFRQRQSSIRFPLRVHRRVDQFGLTQEASLKLKKNIKMKRKLDMLQMLIGLVYFI